MDTARKDAGLVPPARLEKQAKRGHLAISGQGILRGCREATQHERASQRSMLNSKSRSPKPCAFPPMRAERQHLCKPQKPSTQPGTVPPLLVSSAVETRLRTADSRLPEETEIQSARPEIVAMRIYGEHVCGQSE